VHFNFIAVYDVAPWNIIKYNKQWHNKKHRISRTWLRRIKKCHTEDENLEMCCE